MGYKLFKKKVGDDSVELVNDKVYETREKAEAAMVQAENELKEEKVTTPSPGEIIDPVVTTRPGETLIPGENHDPKENIEFFIREA